MRREIIITIESFNNKLEADNRIENSGGTIYNGMSYESDYIYTAFI